MSSLNLIKKNTSEWKLVKYLVEDSKVFATLDDSESFVHNVLKPYKHDNLGKVVTLSFSNSQGVLPISGNEQFISDFIASMYYFTEGSSTETVVVDESRHGVGIPQKEKQSDNKGTDYTFKGSAFRTLADKGLSPNTLSDYLDALISTSLEVLSRGTTTSNLKLYGISFMKQGTTSDYFIEGKWHLGSEGEVVRKFCIYTLTGELEVAQGVDEQAVNVLCSSMDVTGSTSLLLNVPKGVVELR